MGETREKKIRNQKPLDPSILPWSDQESLLSAKWPITEGEALFVITVRITIVVKIFINNQTYFSPRESGSSKANEAEKGKR